jgi:hypothetical protein
MAAPAFQEASNVIPLLPGPDPNDSEDVTVALQTARALQKKGDLRESLRWLRRAADAAGVDGNDRRALVLARAAADMTTLIGASEGAAPPSSLPPASPPPASLPPPPPSNAQRASRVSPAPHASSLPPPLHKAPPPPPLPVQTAPLAPSSPPPLPKPATHPSGRSVPPPLPASHANGPANPPDPGKAQPSDLAKRLAEGTAVRVSFKRSVRDPGLLVVRKLEEGKALPPDRMEGYLVLADPADDPFGGSAPKGK